MIVDLDIYRAAQAAIKAFGETASLHAAIRADESLAEGDMEGCHIWRQIENTIEELRRTAAGKFELIH